MSHGKDAARDIAHGRRGGGWLPAGYKPPERARRCVECGEPILSNIGADRHVSCPAPDVDEPQGTLL